MRSAADYTLEGGTLINSKRAEPEMGPAPNSIKHNLLQTQHQTP